VHIYLIAMQLLDQGKRVDNKILRAVIFRGRCKVCYIIREQLSAEVERTGIIYMPLI